MLEEVLQPVSEVIPAMVQHPVDLQRVGVGCSWIVNLDQA